MTTNATIGFPSSPQAREMADESMVRNLSVQAEAIWPAEEPIFARHPPSGRVLDVGTGTGEISARLLERFPIAHLVGVDLDTAHLDRARLRTAAFGERARFEEADALALPFAPDMFDLTVSRHVLQAVPDPERALAEMVRVTRPGGRLHCLAEDYGMLWCHPTPSSEGSDAFWSRYPMLYGKSVGCDHQVGRKMYTLMQAARLDDIRVDYIVVDTLRVERDVLARIWEAWRDGYTDAMVRTSGDSRETVLLRWQEVIDCVRDPKGYALWQVPIWTAAKPG